MTEKKKETLQNVLSNSGVMLVLIGSTAVKGESLAFFLLGLVLLAVHTFDARTEAKKLVTAEIMLSGTLVFGAVTQLIMSKGFGTPQVFLVILLLGAALVMVEALRKYVEL